MTDRTFSLISYTTCWRKCEFSGKCVVPHKYISYEEYWSLNPVTDRIRYLIADLGIDVFGRILGNPAILQASLVRPIIGILSFPGPHDPPLALLI